MKNKIVLVTISEAICFFLFTLGSTPVKVNDKSELIIGFGTCLAASIVIVSILNILQFLAIKGALLIRSVDPAISAMILFRSLLMEFILIFSFTIMSIFEYYLRNNKSIPFMVVDLTLLTMIAFRLYVLLRMMVKYTESYTVSLFPLIPCFVTWYILSEVIQSIMWNY